MKFALKLAVLVANAALQGRAAGLWLGPYIDLKLTGAAKEYCHVVNFAGGWKAQRFDTPPAYPNIDSEISDYDFRVEGLLGTWFLVGAYTPNIAVRVNSKNHYRVNLSDATAPVRSANAQAWGDATAVPLYRKSLIALITTKPPDHVAYGGFEYTKTGSYPWSVPDTTSRLSPDSSWLVLQSATFKRRTFLAEFYDVFYDVFSTRTGKKLFTIQGSFSGGENPSSSLGTTGWLTERYFIIPLGKLRERCVVCEFAPRRVSEGPHR